MKVLYKKLGIFTTLCYCFGILLIAYLLISIPQDLKNLTLGLPINILEQVNPIFNKLNISIAIVLGLGMTSLILLIFNDRTASSNLQFSVAEKAKEEENAEWNYSEEQSEMNELVIQKIDQIIAENTDLKIASNKVLSAVCNEFEASQGAIYEACAEDNTRKVELICSFAYPIADSKKIVYEFGEGLVGQAAKEGKTLNIDSVPEGYIKILSGLGSSTPTNLILIPFINEGIVTGVAEIASFKRISKKEEDMLGKIFSKLAPKFVQAPEKAPVKKKITVVP
ncbi:MAG: GAF domain-containing protein [Bacteroidota bacterium]|nr:GAF domain-containing protein [Bacteroidota bacterium]